MQNVFLTAYWENLIMANYRLSPELLQDYVPPGTELDFYEGQCYVSLVGFLFRDTKLRGVPIPFHRNFEEINLRFYVRYHDGDDWKRGTVFISEVVPRPAITIVANTLYGEHYSTRQMRHRWDKTAERWRISYGLKQGGRWHDLSVESKPGPVPLREGSEEQFIAEHYWGYTKRGAGRTSEYQVEHPSWNTLPVESYRVDMDGRALYGAAFGEVIAQGPSSVFLAEGSEVQVRQGRWLPSGKNG